MPASVTQGGHNEAQKRMHTAEKEENLYARATDVLPNINRQRRNDSFCCCMTLFAAIAFHSIAAKG